jgi:tetratricopeptide (TPR) repeat protein
MMRSIVASVLIVLALTAMGCSSSFKVVSEPVDAEVFLAPDSKSKDRKSIGKTPLEIPKEDLAKSLPEGTAPGGFLTVIVAKPGFKEQSFTIPASSFGTSLTQLDVKLPEGKDDIELAHAEDLLNRLFLAQRLAVSLQFERAIIEVDRLLSQHPKFARALSMKGSIFLAQKKYDESLKWYEEALKADPQMEETVKLAAKVRELMSGGRKPAEKK